MRRLLSPYSWLALATLSSACGGGTSDVDSGVTSTDAGQVADTGDAGQVRDAGCVDECPLSALMCVGNDSESCAPGPNGCLQWSVTTCTVNQQCVNGECADICQNTCGTACCQASQVCMLGMCCDNPCGDVCCSVDQICEDGACTSGCASPCGGSCCGATQMCENGGCCTPCGSSCCGGSQTCGTDSAGNPACVNPCFRCP